ncbi:unnamed protein product [Blepharisma stoltei]|uniref:Rhodanese domain-containing protein n=1 Tax=Blepharisma stoltei TaxID=1481888 RepID=A0AAU9IZR2_9CILI|nr:unnamed protein product [Blepharisma stoltei]
MVTRFSTLIKTRQLADLLAQRTPLYILDASYDIPGVPGNSKSEHFRIRLPGAKFFEIDEVADKTIPLPHMMPRIETFIDFMKKLRIKNDDNLLVCYDRYGGGFTAPRVWYTFKCFGRKNVAILDGGLPKWISEGYPTVSSEYEIYENPTSENDIDYQYKFDENKVKSLETVASYLAQLKNPTENSTQVLDARPPKRFSGTDPEPRKGIRSGHAKNSKNHFFKLNFNADGTFKSPEELRKQFIDSGINMSENSHTINMCGTGVTACVNLFAMELAGKQNTSLYDGSWTEYATRFPNEQLENEYFEKLA